MLELKNLKKVYKTKGNVEVRALDDISINFPETGMVFLLGKSGSGKSTLLNVTGGLDKPDSGEIIVKGRSSLDFTSSDFDSYRNTFIGFIFQEYNVLGEFTVEDNIGLALELQGKSKDKKAINELLSRVDLDGLGKRKPNTLSGGQKQRVAIARALIKNPEIIMADEPTGSLDSNTGKQVFDTLKKLSKEKLVIVVSHDREFANTYADRIIELKDGKVISDVSRTIESGVDEGNVTINDGVIAIKDADNLSDEDIAKVISALKQAGGEAVITTSKGDVKEVKRICKINDEGKKEGFSKTKTVKTKNYDGKETKFIRSKLPASHALRIGASSLKVKPTRLLFTVFLSVVAFTLFGVLSTMMLYNPIYSIAMSLEDSAYKNIALTKSYDYVDRTYKIDEEGNILFDTLVKEGAVKTVNTRFSANEIANLNNNDEGLDFAGVFTLGKTTYKDDKISDISNDNSFILYPHGIKMLEIKYVNQHYYSKLGVSGFSDCGPEYLTRQGYVLHGRYPENENEIAVPEYIYRMLRDNTGGITKYSDLFTGEYRFDKKIQKLKIVGVVEIPIDDKYEALKINASSIKLSDSLKALKTEFAEVINNSFNNVIFVNEDFYNKYNSAYDVVSFDTRKGLKISNTPFAENDYVLNVNYSNLFTQTAYERYKDSFIFFDKDGKEVEFSMENSTDAYLPVYSILGYSNLVNKFESDDYGITDKVDEYGNVIPAKQVVQSLPENAWYKCKNESNYGWTINPYYKDYTEARRKYADTDNSYLDEEIEVILSTLIANYQAVTGEEIFGGQQFIKDNVYVKNTDNVELKFNVKGYYFIKNDKLSNYTMFNREGLDTVSMSMEESNKYITKIDNIETVNYYKEFYTEYSVQNGKYDKLITKTDNNRSQSMFMLENSPEFSKYHMENAVYTSAYESASFVAKLKIVFLIAGVVAGFISAFMLLNFVSVSISIKRKEIGVLRAVGARSMDVFKIFFAESLIIVLSCFLIASIAGYYVCDLINVYTMQSFINIKLFDYGILSVLMILVISVVVAFIATYLPVRSASKKPPVDSMREI